MLSIYIFEVDNKLEKIINILNTYNQRSNVNTCDTWLEKVTRTENILFILFYLKIVRSHWACYHYYLTHKLPCFGTYYFTSLWYSSMFVFFVGCINKCNYIFIPNCNTINNLCVYFEPNVDQFLIESFVILQRIRWKGTTYIYIEPATHHKNETR